ncbi:hypothetical protein Emag_001875 [Eimeria magna]
MPPLKICPNGVLRDDMCFIMSLPDATPCPGGFMEQLVDGDKLCVATRVARMRLACWGPFEKLEGDVCVERIVRPLVIECPRGSLNFQEKCENVLVEAPKPVCDPGYFEQDGLCIRRRVIPCVETKEKPFGKGFVNREWSKGALSKPHVDFQEKAAFSIALDQKQEADELYALPSAGGEFGGSTEPYSFQVLEQSEASIFVDAKFPPAEQFEEISFGKTFNAASSSPVYQPTIDDDFGNILGGTSFAHAQKIETDGQGFVKRWRADSRSSLPGVHDDSSGTTYFEALTRRLHATEQTPTDGMSKRREAGKAVEAENSGSQMREEVQSTQRIDDGRGTGSLQDSPRQVFLGAPFLPGQSGMYLAGAPLPMSRRPYVSAVNPMLIPLQSPYRPLWHDNRFGDSPRILPRLLKTRGLFKQSPVQEPPTFVASPSSKPQENESAASSSTTKDTTKQLFSSSTNSDTGSQHSNSFSKRKSDAQNQQRRQSLAASSRLHRRLTEAEDAASKDGGDSNRWSGRQQDIDVPEPLSLQRQKSSNANASRGQGSQLSRRLDGTDFIPGCWEEDIQVPTEWACKSNFEFDRDQHICLRMEVFSPDIICDGHVENGLCVRELYCPLDPPPKLKEEKKKKKKEEKKKEEKKDPKKDEKKPDAKKPDSPSKPTKDEQKKTGPGQGETKGQKKPKGGVETTPGGRIEGTPGAVKPPKPGNSETGGSSKAKRTGGGYSKSQGTAVSGQVAEESREETPGSTAQETEASRNAAGSLPSGRQQSRTSRPQSDRRSERHETTVDMQLPERAAAEEEAQPARRNEPSRQRPASRRRPVDRSESAKPQMQNTDSDDEGENGGGSTTAQTQQSRPQQALRRVSAPPRAQGRGEETEDPPRPVLEDNEETEGEDTEDAKRRSGDITGRLQMTQRSSLQPRGRPRPVQTQPTRSKQDRTRETQADDDEEERSGDLTPHLFGRRLQPEPERGKDVQSKHPRHANDDIHFPPQDGPHRAADGARGPTGSHKQRDDEDACDENSEAGVADSSPSEGEHALEAFVRKAPKSNYLTAEEARSSPKVTTLHVRRRLNQTRLPYAYFIMGVNQWRYIHDPVHLLRMETASDRAQEQAALRHNPPLEQVGYLDPRMGVFGPPTRAGPQMYRHDLKDKKKPTTSPLKIREGTLCYRQERKRPLVVCPPGFTANKEGGCYMLIAPEFTCLAVKDRQHEVLLAGRHSSTGDSHSEEAAHREPAYRSTFTCVAASVDAHDCIGRPLNHRP